MKRYSWHDREVETHVEFVTSLTKILPHLIGHLTSLSKHNTAGVVGVNK